MERVAHCKGSTPAWRIECTMRMIWSVICSEVSLNSCSFISGRLLRPCSTHWEMLTPDMIHEVFEFVEPLSLKHF